MSHKSRIKVAKQRQQKLTRQLMGTGRLGRRYSINHNSYWTPNLLIPPMEEIQEQSPETVQEESGIIHTVTP